MIFSTQPAKPNGFPAELDDREWLAARCRSLGDETIASELRVSRKAVLRARQRLGIATVEAGPSSPNGANGANAATLVDPRVTGATNGRGLASVNGARPTNGHARPSNGRAAGADRPTFVSDEEITQRVAGAKKGLADTCAKLVALIDELEWVRRQVAPDETAARTAA
jgi:hypothetical protein